MNSRPDKPARRGAYGYRLSGVPAGQEHLVRAPTHWP